MFQEKSIRFRTFVLYISVYIMDLYLYPLRSDEIFDCKTQYLTLIFFQNSVYLLIL